MSVLCGVSHGTDIPIFPIGPVFKLPFNPTWGISGPNGFNNNFFFTPIAQNGSICVYVKDNNTTNAHSFSASILVSADPSNTTPSDGTWTINAATGLISGAAPSGSLSGIGSSISGAAQIAIGFSGSTTLGGSPETATITIIQTQGSCSAGGNFTGSAIQTLSSVPIIQSIAEGLSQAYLATATVVNPTAAQLVLATTQIFSQNPKATYYDRALLSCSAACTLTINQTSNAGTTCNTATVVGLRTPTGLGTITVGGTTSCAVVPTVANVVATIFIAAGSTTTVDLRGLIETAGGTTGIDVTSSAFTGSASATFFWYEK